MHRLSIHQRSVYVVSATTHRFTNSVSNSNTHRVPDASTFVLSHCCSNNASHTKTNVDPDRGANKGTNIHPNFESYNSTLSPFRKRQRRLQGVRFLRVGSNCGRRELPILQYSRYHRTRMLSTGLLRI